MNEIIMLPAENLSFLFSIYRWGIEVIKTIQVIEGPLLTALIKFITEFGTEKFYMPAILIIFWWIDEKRGLRLGILIIVSAWINSFMKDIFKQPRPYNLEPSLGLSYESSYGAPSGHAQMSLCFWVSMAAWRAEVFAAGVMIGKAGAKPLLRRFLVWASAILFVLLIGFTRLYLGVHFPTDLFAGWILGGAILVLCFLSGPRLEKLFASAGTRSQNICIAVLALAMNGLHPGDRTLPALFLGFCLGYTIMRKYFPFCAQGTIDGKKPSPMIIILRCLTGFLGAAIIYIALRLVFPGAGSFFTHPLWGEFSPFYETGRFIRYGLLGLWASAGAPYTFRRMGLSSSGNAEEPNIEKP